MVNSHKHIAVIGGSGQLGATLQKFLHGRLQDADPQWIFYPRALFDLQHISEIPAPLIDHQPEVLINLAAYTNVDGAEQEEFLANQVNAVGPGQLAAHCQSIGCRMIHISTDYVYGGTGNIPFTEEDPIYPKGVYAKSKAEGERLILKEQANAIILRTSWLYSEGPGKNFLNTIRQLGAAREVVQVVNDQIGTPTYAGDLASVIHLIAHLLVEKGDDLQGGIYNYSNEGVASWYDFAWAIMDLCQLACRVEPVPTTAFPRPAPRPAFSLMSKDKIRQNFDLTIPHWQDGLRRCLNMPA